MTSMEILEKYESPSNETSFAKGIPMKYLKLMQSSLLYFDSLEGVKGFRYCFRGKSKPGFKRPQAWCPRSQADTFAIYERSLS